MRIFYLTLPNGQIGGLTMQFTGFYFMGGKPFDSLKEAAEAWEPGKGLRITRGTFLVPLLKNEVTEALGYILDKGKARQAELNEAAKVAFYERIRSKTPVPNPGASEIIAHGVMLHDFLEGHYQGTLTARLVQEDTEAEKVSCPCGQVHAIVDGIKITGKVGP